MQYPLHMYGLRVKPSPLGSDLTLLAIKVLRYKITILIAVCMGAYGIAGRFAGKCTFSDRPWKLISEFFEIKLALEREREKERKASELF